MLLIGLAACALALALQAFGMLDGLEDEAMARFMRLDPRGQPDPRVVICAVDNASIDALGQWPWARGQPHRPGQGNIAALLDALTAGGARVIAMDIVFSEEARGIEGPEQDAAFLAALERAGNVVLGYMLRSDPPPPGTQLVPSEALIPALFDQVIGQGFTVPTMRDVEPALDPFVEAADSLGFTTNLSQGGRTSRYSLVFGYRDGYYPALALRAAQRMRGQPLVLRPHSGRLPALELGGEMIGADELGRLWINFRGAAGTFPTYSAIDVLEGTLPAGAFTDKLVFVGVSDEGSFDRVETPLGTAVPGVEVHATVADNLLSESYILDTGVQAAISFAALLALGIGVALLVAGTQRFLVGSLIAIALVCAWPIICFAVFAGAGWHLQLSSPMLAGLFALVPTLRYQIGRVESRSRQIRRVFQQYVSAAVVDEMLRDPEAVKLGGESREMTVMFSDIRGFTSLSERLTPQQLTRLLNDYFTPLTHEVLAAGGTLDKYIGDALMAFFGAPVEQPDHARRACQAALAMHRKLAELNRAWSREGRLPSGLTVGTGFGINSGEMSVGNMGSEAIFDYTVLGDNVNLGSRIEGLNKLYGTDILISDATLLAAVSPSGEQPFLTRQIDRVRVKGKEKPVSIHELVAERASADDRARQRVERFEDALRHYHRQDFAAARGALTQLQAALGEDGPSTLYLERCLRYQADPPAADWDGVETMTSK